MAIDEGKFQEIIVDRLGVDPNQITPEASFIDDLGADSLLAQVIGDGTADHARPDDDDVLLFRHLTDPI